MNYSIFFLFSKNWLGGGGFRGILEENILSHEFCRENNGK